MLPQMVACKAAPDDAGGTFTPSAAEAGEEAGSRTTEEESAEGSPEGGAVANTSLENEFTSRLAAGSTSNIKYRKKSTPIMGN